MEFFMPEFRQLVREGCNVVVAGRAFGCGSSRESAVNALLGIGVKCVIARSFSFIYARNQPNLGLLGITLDNEEFWQTAQQGEEITVDTENCHVRCGGKEFSFQLSEMEKQLISAGGLTTAFKRYGTKVFDVMCRPKRMPPHSMAKVTDIESVSA